MIISAVECIYGSEGLQWYIVGIKYVVSNLLGGLEVIHQNMWSFEMIIAICTCIITVMYWENFFSGCDNFFSGCGS